MIAPPPDDAGPIRVLVVDDDSSVIEAYRTALGAERDRDSGALEALRARLFTPEAAASTAPAPPTTFAMDTAIGAEEAVQQVRAAQAAGTPHSVIFLDMRMPPGPDGLWAAQQIRALDPVVDIVICTAYSDVDPADFGRRAPPSEKLLYLQKPFHLHEVRQMAHALGLKRAAENHVQRLAYFDSLTGLPNRARIWQTTEAAIEQARREDGRFALLYLDLDRFKRINDALGHAVGDELLRETARRLRNLVRTTDTVVGAELPEDGQGGEVARLGGDEFLVLLWGVSRVEEAACVARRLQRELSVPVALDLCEVMTTPSIGISLYPTHGEDAGALIRNADLAMYFSKRRGRGSFALYDVSMSDRSLRRLTLENLLRRALEHGEFSLRYQPQVDLQGGTFCGMEALLRWNCPEVGAVSPAEFIPVAEECGLILSIGEWVLREACRTAERWRREGLAVNRIAVNVSALQFKHGSFPDQLRQILADTGLPPGCLELEVTETLLMSDEDHAREILGEIKAIGVNVAIDDFGTGYSSLSRLQELQVDRLKIDRSFVGGIMQRGDDAAITEAIINMGRTLGLEVIAEGVEDFDQVKFLQEHSCGQAQGFLVSQPLTEEDARAFLARYDDATIIRQILRTGTTARAG